VEEPTIIKSKKGTTDPEFDKEHAHCSFFDMKGFVHRGVVLPTTNVNSDFYCDVLRRLRENTRQKRPELWRSHNWVLHHDNASAHTSLKSTEFVLQNTMIIVPHPPFSPDLAPCDFALFLKLKMNLKG
jgi:histone-lysine N-methyltransferase SETMAR